MPLSWSRRPTPAVALLLAVLAAIAAPGASVSAQAPRPGVLAGRVIDEDGQPVGQAVLRATQGAETILAYARDNGDFRIGGLEAGLWTVSVRRLGFRPIAVEVEMLPGGLQRTFTLRATRTELDPVLIAARWTGVRGVVGDARRIDPLAGASVRVMGSDAAVGSDSLGHFAVALPGGRDVLLRIERAGYQTRLVSAVVPENGYVELDIPMDTNPSKPRDYWVWRDLDQRIKFATPRAVLVSREELERTDAISLGNALPLTPAMTRAGVQINRRACVYVNGVARPNFPVDAINAGEVEFVEAYPPGSEITRTLAMRWPPGGVCGVTDGTYLPASVQQRQIVQYVSVWLKAP